MYPLYQSVYRQHHEIALLKVTNDILLSMNSQHVTLLVLLDLNAALDTADNEILIRCLYTKFGERGKVLN